MNIDLSFYILDHDDISCRPEKTLAALIFPWKKARA